MATLEVDLEVVVITTRQEIQEVPTVHLEEAVLLTQEAHRQEAARLIQEARLQEVVLHTVDLLQEVVGLRATADHLQADLQV